MNKFSAFLCAMLLTTLLTCAANATLWDRGGGLIYDDVLDILWLQDANHALTSGYDSDGLMSWNDAVAWADQLEFGGFNDWRLPSTVYTTYQYSYDGSTTLGYNNTSSEMGYMFYENLENLGYYDFSGTGGQLGWGLNNTDPFINLQPYYYWSGTDTPFSEDQYAWHFQMGNGYQGSRPHTSIHYAWAVRDGDVPPVPEPSTILLVATGLIGLVGFRKFKK